MAELNRETDSTKISWTFQYLTLTDRITIQKFN